MMVADDEFITRLIGFGLSEKEAQLYLHLLKYGPKMPSPLAKSLKTYREDVHRTLTSLIEKGMVRPSLDTPTIYTAVDLNAALDAAVKKHESELREMEVRKRELQELSEAEWFRPSNEVTTFKILKTLKEIVSTATPVIEATQKEFLWVVPESGLVSASLWFNEAAKGIIQRGGKALGITDITYSAIPLVQEVLDIGEEVRHFDGYRGAYYGVFDRKHCISAINIDITSHRLDEPATMLYTDDTVYAKYLVSTFEMLWKQSVPAEEQIQELLEQGPPQS
jgi:HTH-type transcriptional regulator, sugar sensing transcriptional regulator